MNNIPKPLKTKLVLTFFAGTGCFFTGLLLSLIAKDLTLLALSTSILALSLIRGILLFRRIKSGSYSILEATCTKKSGPFEKMRYAIFADSAGNRYTLYISKTERLAKGQSYRLYFRSPSIPSRANQLLTKALSEDSLLGIEKIPTPSQGTDNL